MRLKEQKFWDRIRKHLPPFGIQLERIENVVGEGTPDVNAICNGVVTRIELKAVHDYPKRAATPVLGEQDGLSIDQKNWHLEYRKFGGRSLILITVGSKDFYAIEGRLGDDVNKMPREELFMNSVADAWPGLARYLGAALALRENIVKDEL